MDRYNADSYPDPTAAEALENVMREEKVKCYKPCVFICSPFAGDTEKKSEEGQKISEVCSGARNYSFCSSSAIPSSSR